MLDLFSGIGGFSLGLERAGMRTLAFCEIEPYCQAVLRKHWPDVPIFDDVTKLKGVDVGSADVICGGFPCQDISLAGKGAGIEGARSGLWKEYARLIGEIRPRYSIIENVPALRGRGLSVVLSDLAALGYDAEWHCVPASHIGAHHRRDRIWIVAYPDRRGGIEGGQLSALETRGNEGVGLDYTFSPFGLLRTKQSKWEAEPAVGRVVDGFPGRMDQLKALGNAIVPQIAEIIGRAIVNFDKQIALTRD